jgi:CNT family concentrative nucleoside transporter
MQERLMSLIGLFMMMFFAWCLSSNRRVIPYRVIIGGVGLQLLFALIILKTTPGNIAFQAVGDFFTAVLDYVDAGSLFVFGEKFRDHFFAFKVLPTIIFFSALMSLLYYIGFMQLMVRGVAVVMYKVLGTSGAETLAAAINIFVGQSEAPLAVKPYVATMTRSELMAVMVGGFANIAGGVLAAYVGMGVDAGHLVTASVISAPASLLIAKIMQPEVDVPLTQQDVRIQIKSDATNVLDAVATGASEGLSLALNVGAMLIAFLALIAMGDAVIAGVGKAFGMDWSLALFLGRLFSPVAFLMGVPWDDASRVGELLGLKMVANEFIAYEKFSRWLRPDSEVVLSERAKVITTYALCGFANFGSIGIQIGGISPLAPERRKDLAQLGFRAMLGGTLATFMCACIAGILL